MLAEWYEIVINGKTYELFNNQRTVAYAQAMGIKQIEKFKSCPGASRIPTDPGPYITDTPVYKDISALAAQRAAVADGPDIDTTTTFTLDCDDDSGEPAVVQVNNTGLSEPPEPLDIVNELPFDIQPGVSKCYAVPKAGSGCDFGDEELEFSVAPWWDDCHPASYQLTGPILFDVGGWGSTFSRVITPNALSGSSHGLSRRDGRCLTFDFYLIGCSESAIEYGVSYYDNLFTIMANCGKFDLYSAAFCPPGETDPKDAVRHIRNVSVSLGPEVTETIRMGDSGRQHGEGRYYARVQFTLCSEDPWIYQEPEVCLENVLNNLSCDKAFSCPKPRPVYQEREFLVERDRFPIMLQRCGGVCKIGDWDWEQTQFGGGDGVVVIADFEEEEGPECSPYQVILAYDAETGETAFSTIRWSSDGEIPCDCDIVVEELIVRNPGFNPCDGECEGNEKWMTESPSSGDNCALVKLNFSGPNCGTWTPLNWAPAVGALPPCEAVDCSCPKEEEECPPPNGTPPPGLFDRTCSDFRVNPFPPIGATLTIDRTSCEGVECEFVKDCRIEIDTINNLWVPINFERDCWAQFPDPLCNYVLNKEQNTGKVCRNLEVLVDLPPCAEIPAGKEGVPRLIFPSFAVGDCEEACWETVALPTDTSTGPSSCFTDPEMVSLDCCEYENNSTTFSAVQQLTLNTGSSDMRNFRVRAWEKLSEAQISPCDAGVLENPNYNPQQCEYLRCAESSGFIISGDGYINTTGLGSFELRQKWSIYANCLGVVGAISFTDDGAYQPDIDSEFVPLPFSRACPRLLVEGQPEFFSEDGEPIILTPSPSPFQDCGPLIDFTVCDAFTGSFYCDQEEVWSLEIGILPENSTLTIDGESGRITLARPGKIPEAANRYISGGCSQPYRDFVAEPCKTYFIQVEIDCENSAPDLNYQIKFAKRSSSSGGLTLGNSGGGF